MGIKKPHNWGESSEDTVGETLLNNKNCGWKDNIAFRISLCLVLLSLQYPNNFYRRYAKNCPNVAAFEKAEQIAIASKAGVWGKPGLEKPWDYRRQKRSK